MSLETATKRSVLAALRWRGRTALAGGESAAADAAGLAEVASGTAPAVGAARSEASIRLAVRALCAGLVLAQLVGTMAWSWHVLDRASLSWDFGIYYQPWSLIAHGHLLPRNTFQGGYAFWRNDGELIVYVLAPLYWLFPNHQLGYLWLQDLAIAVSTLTCLAIVADALPWRLEDPPRQRMAAAAARVLVTVLVVANPWVYWTASFDIHMEVFGTCFALLALRAALRRRRSVVVFALLTAMCGAAATVFVIGVGVAATVTLGWRERDRLRAPSGRHSRAPHRRRIQRHELAGFLWPLAISVAGVVWLFILGAAHATQGSPTGYGYLVGPRAPAHPSLVRIALGLLEHPGAAARTVASHHWNLWANLAPAGLLGLLTPVGLFLAGPTLLANNLLKSPAFSYPSFQNFVVYCSVAVGSAVVAAAALRRQRLSAAGAALTALMLASAGGWAASWLGTAGTEWVHLSPGSAAVVKEVAQQAAAGDEVVASQGFVGMLAGRQNVYAFSGPMVVPVRSRTVWFVLSLTQGVQVATQNETLEAIGAAASLPGVQPLQVDDNGIWVYRWHPPAGTRSVALGEPGSPYPIWMSPGPQGRAVTSGPASGWRVVSNGQSGYLFVGDYFQLAPGRYVASVRLRSRMAVTAEVWDDNTGKLIAGTVRSSTRPVVVSVPFSVQAPKALPDGPLAGSGLFRDQPIPPVVRATVEVRVWLPAGARATAWWASVAPAPPR